MQESPFSASEPAHGTTPGDDGPSRRGILSAALIPFLATPDSSTTGTSTTGTSTSDAPTRTAPTTTGTTGVPATGTRAVNPLAAGPAPSPKARCGPLPGSKRRRTLTSSPPPRSTYEYVTFDDIAPAYLTLTQSWNALGMDDQDRVYIVWTSTRDDGREDSALFRYTHATRKREFLGTYIDVATAHGNIREGEQIPKGHTRILQVGRKMFMASQGFHDFKAEITDLPSYRGAHLFCYDLDTGAFDDVSSRMPGGVVIEHQGIVALNYSAEHRLLVGLAHPLGDIVLIDPGTGSVKKVVPGIPWELNQMVSREIVVTCTGKVYTYRGAEDPTLRELTNEVWCYDLATGVMRRTGQWLQGGFWNGQAVTRDGQHIFLSTVSGDLYRLDVHSGTFTHLGYFIDNADYAGADAYRIAYLYGIALTADENQLLGIPIIVPTADDSQASEATRLTSYNIPLRRFSKRIDFDVAVFTGSNHRDRRGNIYQAAFDWETNCHLAVLKPPYR